MDGKYMGVTPWKDNVLAVKHTFRLECLEGKAVELVDVKHNEKHKLTDVRVVGGPSGKVSITTHDLSTDTPLSSMLVMVVFGVSISCMGHGPKSGKLKIWMRMVMK